MSPNIRAREIISRFSRDRDFAVMHSPLEILAMAYDDVVEQRLAAEERARIAEAKVESTIGELAAMVATPYERVKSGLGPPNRPPMWVIRLEPVIIELRMLAALSSNWDTNLRLAVIKEAGNLCMARIAKALDEGSKRGLVGG